MTSLENVLIYLSELDNFISYKSLRTEGWDTRASKLIDIAFKEVQEARRCYESDLYKRDTEDDDDLYETYKTLDALKTVNEYLTKDSI